MKFEKIDSKQKWNELLSNFKKTSIYNSWEWREIEKEYGNFENYVVKNSSEILALLNVRIINGKRGSTMQLRHSPTFHRNFDKQTFSEILKFLDRKAKSEHIDVIRINPLIGNTDKNTDLLKRSGYNPYFLNTDKSTLTLIINLTKPIDYIKSDFRKSTRQSINKAKKSGVKVKHTRNLSLLDDFLIGYKEVLNRGNWVGEGIDRVKKEIITFINANKAEIFVAFLGEVPISGAVFFENDKEVVYQFGGSLREYRDIPSSHLIHFESIQYYKNEGFEKYNMWGITLTENKSHPWYGVTLFKMGFGGDIVDTIKPYENAITLRGKLVRVLEFFEPKFRQTVLFKILIALLKKLV